MTSGCFVLPNPWDVGSARYLRQPRLQGAGDDQRRRGLEPRACRRRRAAGGDARPHPRDRRSHRPAGQRGLPGRLRARAGGRGGECAALRRDRRRRPLDRGCDGRRRRAAVRSSLSRSSGSPRRVRRSMPPAATCSWWRGRSAFSPATMRRSRRRSIGSTAFAEAGADCLYAPGVRSDRRHLRDRRGGGAEAGQCACRMGRQPDGRAARGARRAAHQRRRGACPHGLGRRHAGGARDRRDGQLRCLRGRRAGRRTQPAVRRNDRKRGDHERDQSTACRSARWSMPRRPSGPRRCRLDGRFCRIEKLDLVRHGESLWHGGQGARRSVGLYGLRPVSRRARPSCAGSRSGPCCSIRSPMPWSIRRSDRAIGIVTLMEIRPAMGVIEMGNIVYTPAAAAHRRRRRKRNT